MILKFWGLNLWASALIFTLPPKNETVRSGNSRCQLGAALDKSKAFLRPRKPLGENGRKRAPALQSWTSHSNFAMEKQARFASSPKRRKHRGFQTSLFVRQPPQLQETARQPRSPPQDGEERQRGRYEFWSQ